MSRKEYEDNKKRLEDFPGKDMSPTLTALDSLKKDICNTLSQKYGSPEKMHEAGVCGIVDARKIASKRYDLVTLEFLFRVLKNDGYEIDVNTYKISLIQKYNLSTLNLAPSLADYPEATRVGLITIDRLIEYIDLKIGFDVVPRLAA